MEKKMIALKSSDNEIFEIEEAAAMKSETLWNLIEDGVYDGTPIPIPNVSSYILERVIEYCHRHSALEKSPSVAASTSTNIDDLKISDLKIGDIDWGTSDSDWAASSASSSSASSSASSSSASSSASEVPDFSYPTTIDYDDIEKFDKEFVNVKWETLFETIKAASYLNIKSLIDLTCKAVYDYIIVANWEEIYQVFNIKKDFTPEEEAKIYSNHRWAFR